MPQVAIEKKETLRIRLLMMDIIVLLSIFAGVIFLFEFVIKPILMRNNVNKFYESMRTTQFDFKNSIEYINEKKDLPYEENVDKVFEYLKLSTLKRSKYDNSLFLILFPKDQNKIIAGKRNSTNLKYTLKDVDYNFFKDKIEDLNQIRNNPKSTKDINHIPFSFQGWSYIGAAEYASTEIKKDFDRNSKEIINPIIITADRDDEFFFLINRVRNIFLIILFTVFGIGGYFKISSTVRATKEIQLISEGISSISDEIRNTGIVKRETKEMETKFNETFNLDRSFTSLVKSLVSVGDIISGIADRDLFIATLKNDDSILKPHDEMMAVVFLDIQGFTTIAEKHKNEIMKIVNSIWMNVEKVISVKKAKINKYMGDACLIIFRENDNKSKNPTALNAFLCAIELLDMVQKVSEELDISFNFRVGVDYGKVTYGKTGTDNNYELGVIGDPVNTASRLEALNKQYHTNFLITDNAFQAAGLENNKDIDLSDNFKKDFTINCFRVDKARPKGKKEAKELFTVLKKEDDSDYSFIGSDKKFKNNNFSSFEKLVDSYIGSISAWQEYSKSKDESQKENAKKSWARLAKDFAEFYYKEKFPPAESYIKSLIKFEEFDEFNSKPEQWLKKDAINTKEPSEEWIELGTKELDK